MKLYLIRHGETEYNRKRILQGHAEIPLNDLGIRQASKLAQRFSGIDLDQIYASDLRRAAMTAAILASMNGAPLVYDAGFRERDPGDLTHQSYEIGYRFFLDPDYTPPGGETQGEFEQRVKDRFDRLIDEEGDTDRDVAVVTHGMVCRAFVKTHLHGVMPETDRLAWPNTCVSTLEYVDGGWNVHELGCAAHLEGEPDLTAEDSAAETATGG